MRATPEEVAAFRPGVYQHWKGPYYRALFLGQDSTNRELEGLKWAADWCERHAGDATLDQTGVERKTLLRVATKLRMELEISASSEEPMVAYVSLNTGPHSGNICFRELWQWNEAVYPNAKPPSFPRFHWIKP